MFKKVEIWILYLVFVFVFISYIIFGAMIIREKENGPYIPIISPISKVVYFLAEIPKNIKNVFDLPLLADKNRFKGNRGFIGNPNELEKYLLLARYNSDLEQSIVELVDLKNFKVIHTWNPNIISIFKKIKNNKWDRLMVDRGEGRFRIQHPILYDDGSLIFSNETPLIKIDKDNELVWMNDDESHHHSNEADNEGNVWSCIWYSPYKTKSDFIGNWKRAENIYGIYTDDGIRKTSSDGEIMFEKSISSILIDNNMEHLLFSNTDKFKTDPNHLNDIQPVLHNSKYMKKGDVFISLRNHSMIILYRPTTNKVIWKSKGGYFFNQHDVDILDSNKISIFDNNVKVGANGWIIDGHNRIVIYDFETDKYTYYLNNSLIENDVRTDTQGLCEIFPNGNIFIEETTQGRILYLNSDGSSKWQYINRGENGEIGLINWSRILYKNEEIEIVRSFLKTKIEAVNNE